MSPLLEELRAFEQPPWQILPGNQYYPHRTVYKLIFNHAPPLPTREYHHHHVEDGPTTQTPRCTCCNAPSLSNSFCCNSSTRRFSSETCKFKPLFFSKSVSPISARSHHGCECANEQVAATHSPAARSKSLSRCCNSSLFRSRRYKRHINIYQLQSKTQKGLTCSSSLLW